MNKYRRRQLQKIKALILDHIFYSKANNMLACKVVLVKIDEKVAFMPIHMVSSERKVVVWSIEDIKGAQFNGLSYYTLTPQEAYQITEIAFEALFS